MEGRVPERRFAGRSYPVTFLRLNDADAVYWRFGGGSGFWLNRLESRALSLYCFSQALGERSPISLASNGPGSATTLPRHFFFGPVSAAWQEGHFGDGGTHVRHPSALTPLRCGMDVKKG